MELNHRCRRIRTKCFRYTTKRSRDGRTRTGSAGSKRRFRGPRPRGVPHPTSRFSVRAVGFEPTVSWPPARRDTRLRYALPSSNDPCGIRTQPGQLEKLATSPEVERAVSVWTYLLCVPANRIVLEVGWKALESFSPGLQPGAKPSQLPAQTKEKPGVLCVTPGFESSRKA